MASLQAPDKLPVRAVQRAFDLLALLGSHNEGRTLSGLARDSSLPVSTVARLLATLEHSGFAKRDADGQYGPGARLMQIGSTALRGSSVYELAEPHLQRLSQKSGETCNLAVRVDAERAVYLRQLVSPRSIHHSSWLGRTLSLRKTAIGAALLGKIERAGYIARRNTIDPDVTAIAAPIYGPLGDIVAAYSITGPTFRISDQDLIRFGALVVEETRSASAELGVSAGSR